MREVAVSQNQVQGQVQIETELDVSDAESRVIIATGVVHMHDSNR